LVADTQPEGAGAALVEVIDDDTGETAAFSESGAVSNEVCGAGAEGSVCSCRCDVAVSLVDIRKAPLVMIWDRTRGGGVAAVRRRPMPFLRVLLDGQHI
jgi:hypothetical protein